MDLKRYEFQILCLDEDKTCNFVMDGMKKEDFAKVKKKKLLNADHVGLKECESIVIAEKVGNELMQKFHGNIKRVTIVPQ